MRLTFLLVPLVLGLAVFATADESKLSVDDLVTLIELEIDDAEIVAKIRAAKGLNLTPGDLKRLERAGASQRVLAAAQTRLGAKGQGVVQRTLTLLQKKAGEKAILDYLLSVKKLPKITTDDILRLRRAGASKNVLRALQGRYMPAGHEPYTHPLNFYTLLHPTEFKPIDFRDEGEHTVAFTSDRTAGVVTDAEELKTALYIRLSPMDAYSRWVDQVPVEELIQRMGKQRAAELKHQRCACGSGTGFAGVRSTLAGVPGAHVFNERTVGDTRLRERLWIGFTKRFYVRVHVVAPKGDFDAVSAKLETALRTLRLDPNRPRTGRLDEPLDRRTFLEQYRESVVMIRAHFGEGRLGYGTGFFVREDGYVLTNHHVVFNQGRAATKIEVVWDAEVPKDPGDTNRVLPAQLIDAVIGDGPLVDIALLRVPRTKWRYKAMPLSPIADGHVQAEDEVIALGFPVPTSFKRVGRLITTNGHLSRINRLADIGASKELLDDAVLDITINKGNSGGP
ncbi:MAG: serine protease, partial [Planctomycetota bacterium]|nr:serine protease [Planctomycetota bacterium]